MWKKPLSAKKEIPINPEFVNVKKEKNTQSEVFKELLTQAIDLQILLLEFIRFG